MSKAVMISIKPQWCERIAKGEKIIEFRKTKPKLEVPFKCYIYCTKGKNQSSDLCVIENKPYEEYLGNGHVIGEFFCNEISLVSYDDFDAHYFDMVLLESTDKEFVKGGCISCEELFDYVNDDFYAWHISNLVIYDKPKKLSEFHKVCKGNCYAPCPHYMGKEYGCEPPIIEKAPQSWCYVEDNNEM